MKRWENGNGMKDAKGCSINGWEINSIAGFNLYEEAGLWRVEKVEKGQIWLGFKGWINETWNMIRFVGVKASLREIFLEDFAALLHKR